jgi:hypothetical protein
MSMESGRIINELNPMWMKKWKMINEFSFII